MGNGNSVMLPAKSVGTALNDVELGIGVSTLCLPGVIRIYNIVFRSVDDQHRAPIGLDFLLGIHADHISHIAPSQFHGSAVYAFRDILGVEFGKHHLSCPGIIGDA